MTRRRIRLVVAAAIVLLAVPPQQMLAATPKWTGFQSKTPDYIGIDGYLRQSGTPSTQGLHINYIGLKDTDAGWVQMGTYQGAFRLGTSTSRVHMYWENVVSGCYNANEPVDGYKDYYGDDLGEPPTPNYAYYVSEYLSNDNMLGCQNGTAVWDTWYTFQYGDYWSPVRAVGYMSKSTAYAQAVAETQGNPLLGTDYFGCDHSRLCGNEGYGLHVQTLQQTWDPWTPVHAANLYLGNPPYYHHYVDYWSFATCNVTC